MDGDEFQGRSEEARQRAAEAVKAAERARRLVDELRQGRPADPLKVSEAEERRILAENRALELETSLATARQRSVNAHESAARADSAVGKHKEAAAHREAADRERQTINDEALEAERRRREAKRGRSRRKPG